MDPWASDRNVWPVFCMTINHPAIIDTPRLNINKEWAYIRRLHRIVKAGGKKAHLFHDHKTEKLQYVIKSIRSLECNSTFVADRNEAMHEYHDTIIKNSPERDYSFINFAYGMVFLYFPPVIHRDPRCKKCRSCSSVKWPRFCSFGTKCWDRDAIRGVILEFKFYWIRCFM